MIRETVASLRLIKRNAVDEVASKQITPLICSIIGHDT